MIVISQKLGWWGNSICDRLFSWHAWVPETSGRRSVRRRRKRKWGWGVRERDEEKGTVFCFLFFVFHHSPISYNETRILLLSLVAKGRNCFWVGQWPAVLLSPKESTFRTLRWTCLTLSSSMWGTVTLIRHWVLCSDITGKWGRKLKVSLRKSFSSYLSGSFRF